MSNIENSICEAIELIVNKSISEAGYDRTIQAIVKGCVDASIGKYKVVYQDSQFYAYATSADVTYTNNSNVYVLIPGNDMSKDKTILGTVDKLGINYVTQAEGDEAYDYIGTNCASSVGEIPLSSYRKPNSPTAAPTTYVETIYPSTAGKVNIDVTSLNQYIKESSSLVCGAVFKTALKPEQQYKGNYGIIFGLRFTDNANANASGQEVVRYYTVDIDNMTGNPYKLTLGKRQYGIFEIDGVNFISVDSISVFTKDFPHLLENEADLINDIFISQIEIAGAAIMSEDEINGCGISFSTPNGAFFADGASDSANLRITANIKMKGKRVDAISQKIPFYWFKEDLSITAKSPAYSKYGGRGWRCLNSGNIIEGNILTESGEVIVKGTIDNGTLYELYRENGIEKRRVISHGKLSEDAQVEWVNIGDTYTLHIKDATSTITKIKCVIVYDGSVYSKIIEIKNLNKMPVVEIESDAGTQFYYDIGRPNLTCKVKVWNTNINSYQDVTSSNYKYIWASEDMYGNLTNLPTDAVQNETDYTNYQKAKKELAGLQDEINRGLKFPNAEASNLQTKQATVDNFKYTQMVYSNQLLKVAVNEITTFMVYKCSVFDSDDVYLGTASIKLLNTLDKQDMYTLIINNGTQTYQYDEYGTSPASKAADNPISLPALTFSIFDNLGNALDKDVLRNCTINWKIPIKKTMLQNIQYDGENGGPDAAQEYQTIHQATTLTYDINNKYYYEYKNNDIELNVDYKGMNLTAKTNLTFIKQGEDGTNGTDYTCKIVPNSNQTNISKNITLTIDNNSRKEFNFKYNKSDVDNILIGRSGTTKAPFIVKIYKAGEEVFSGSTSGNTISSTGESVPITIKWEILANKYNSTVSDPSDLTIDENNGIINYTGNAYNNNIAAANIIKCTIYYGNAVSAKMSNRYSIYATLPIIIARVNDPNYRIILKENTGFKYVEYTSDGTTPKYDTSKPFEIEVTKVINNVTETVSMSPNTTHGIRNFTWNTQGRIYDFSDKSFVNSTDLIHQDSSNLQANQRAFKPNTNYSGLCVNNTVTCSCAAGTIYIPIHMFLNKYGFAELNGWDGNSIQFNKDGGVILAPEIGTGKKETDNTFTGVLIGEVQEPNRTTSDIGLLGYRHGARSFFVDAEDGSAIFGSKGKGQILLDPSQSKGLIYSHNFWKTENYNDKGKPQNYTYRDNNYRANTSNTTGKGMIIDLTSPEIFFGNGTFYVSSDGYLHARGGGDIGGWTLDDYQLYANNKQTGMNSSNTAEGCKTVTAPLPTGDSVKRVAFWAGGTTTPKFYVTHDGYLRCEDATIGSGTNKIYIGKGSNSESALYTSGKGTKTTSNSGFYLGTDGFALGSTHNITYNSSSKTVSAFQVDNDGTLYAKAGYIGSSTTGWNIKTNALTNGKTSYDDTNKGVYLGTSGIGLGEGTFYVSSSGALHAVSGEIGGWKLTTNAIRSTDDATFSNTSGMYFGSSGIRLGSTFSVTSGGVLKASSVDISGKIAATSGTIGGWTINQSSLTANSGKVSLTSGGSLSGPNWSITSDGKATFSNVNITGGTVAGKTVGAGIAGGNINTGTVGSTQLGSGSVTTGKIQDAAITSAKIANAAITSAKIANAAITSAKINDAAITNAKIANASITNAKISGKISADHLDVDSITIKAGKITVQGESGNQGKHEGQTFSMTLQRNLTSQIVLYFCKGICVGWSAAK